MTPNGPVSVPVSTMRAGHPEAKQFAGTSLVTTLAAAITQLLAIVTPGMMILRAPI
jgi:hypothetical protein